MTGADILAAHVQTPALVYVRGLSGPHAQIWHEPTTDHAGYWRGRILAWHRITRGAGRALLLGGHIESLTELFPPPEPLPFERMFA